MRHTREKYERDKANRESWNALEGVGENLRLPIQTYEDWRDEHLWMDELRTNPFLTFEQWRAEQ